MEKRFYSYPTIPIKGLSLSTSGLLALADLSTIAKRTALTGTSTWLDIFVLAPGLHYQQNAESIGQPHVNAPFPEVTNLHTGTISRITNTATIHYLRRINKSDRTIIIDVGIAYSHTHIRIHGQRGRIFQPKSPPSSKIAAILYSLGPLLTLTAIILEILIQDWWGLSLILALMLSRSLNVWTIQQRTKDQPPPSNHPNDHQCWWVLLDDNHRICLRGLRHDLEAITTGEWMRAKTEVEEYLEAFAKMIVHLVAVFGSNQTQSSDIILMVLLGLSSGILALSNSFTTSFNMNGRTAVVTPQGDPKRESSVPTLTGTDNHASTVSNFEKQETAAVLKTTYPFSNEVNYV